MRRLAASLALSLVLGGSGCVRVLDFGTSQWFGQTSKPSISTATEDLTANGSPPVGLASSPMMPPVGTTNALSWNGIGSTAPATMPALNLATAPRRPLPLQQAVLMGLQKSEIVHTLSGSVRIEPITALDPAIADAELRKESARFDPRASASYFGSRINQPPDSFFGPGLSTDTRRDEANFAAGIEKLWPWGTTTRLTYDPSLGYLFFPQGTSGINPAYTTATVFEVRQPLLRAGGWKVNTAPIQIAAARANQTQWEVTQVTLAQLRSITDAYWKLHAAMISLQAVESVLPLADEVVRIEQLRLESQRSIYMDVARASVNLENLKRQRSQAQLNVTQREYDLRQLLGLPSNDGTLLTPIDTPSQLKANFDVATLMQTAYSRRPDLNRRRSRREEQEWRLVAARNGKLPQLDLRALTRTSGLDTRLDDSLSQLSTFEYTDWTVGLEFSVPLGNRRAKADVESAELQLMRELALLRGFEEQVAFEFAGLLAELQTTWERYESAMRQVQYTQEWLRLARIRFASPPAANRGDDWLLLALYDYQVAMQSYITAYSTASQMLADYNTLLVRVEEAQGTLLDRWQIGFVDGSNAIVPPVAPDAKDLGGHSVGP
ncbi:MAG: TolC family protein [Planctomycetaceae bacterium]